MGFLDRMSGSRVNAAGTTTQWAADDDRWYTNEPGLMSRAGRAVSPDLAMRNAAVYRAVMLRARTIASLPFMIYQVDPATGNAKEARNHPIYDLLQYEPNRWQTAFDFKVYLQQSLDLRGNGYAEIIAGRRGFADRLEVIHPDRVTVERMPDGSLRYKVAGDRAAGSNRQSQDRVLLQDEMLHLRSPMAPGLVGISPIAYARETVGLALAAEEHGARMFSNGARPSGVVTVPKTMTEAGFERFRAQWTSLYAGLQNAMKTPILEDGAKFEPIQMTAEDAQFIATREFQIEEICRWFDVPPILLHHATKTTSWGTGVEAIMLAWVRNDLNPLLKAWTDTIRRDLILAKQIYEPRFDTEGLTRGDSKAQADYYSRLVLNGVLTRNEARAELGYNPLDGLDEPLTPTNTTTSDNLPGNGGNTPQKASDIGTPTAESVIQETTDD